MPTDILEYIKDRAEILANKQKRQLIKEMARELYIQPETGSLKHCVLYAKQFYDDIEAELDKALEE